MAEFKLGRIRFVWKGDWVENNVYYQDDVVAFGGKTYICTVGHTSQASFFSDFNIVPPKWNLMSEGQTWRGDWRNETEYRPGDIVKYGSSLYLCDDIHTSSATTGTDTYVVTVRADDTVNNGVFLIDGVIHPDIQMPRGKTFIWNQDDASNLFTGLGLPRHPMVLSTTLDGTHNGGTIYEDGVSYFLDDVEVADAAAYDAGFTAATTRRMVVTIPQDAPDTLYYFCYRHSGMSGVASSEIINIGIENDLDNWSLYAEGLDWKGDWHEDFYYRVNDFVKYGGTTYVCTTFHQSTGIGSNLGLEPDILNWEIFNQGLEFKGNWTASTRYKINDLVRYGAGIYIASTPHESSAEFVTDNANWTKFVEGFQYENDWTPSRSYQPGDIVRYGGNQYISKTTNAATIPTSSTDDWDIFTEGFRFIGDWGEDSSNQHYKVGEVVRLGGFTYVCIQDHESAQQPPNAEYWKLVNEGFRWRGEWLDDQEYYEGDVVRYGDSTYYCVLQHISEGDDYSTETPVQPGGGAEGSRPDLADSGQYWAVLAVGTEQSVLTTEGDLVYYSGNAPTRLPIGNAGQVLQVSNDGLPSWEFLQSIEDVYYVAEEGIDSPFPEYGSNIDRPWKSIRYACEQIEKGPKFPNAQKLLELNRSFVQREVTAYIRDQVDNATPGSIWENFDYDTVKCERDVGFVIDRIIHDMGQGGNLKIRAAAQTFLGVLADGPFSTEEENNGTGPYPRVGEEAQQSVAAYQYMLTLLGNILANEVPDTIYQNVTDDSTAIIDQYININLQVEATALSRVTELANIIITVLDTQDKADIPERVVPQTLIKVSAGKHYETLPIRVPAYCAVMGDELRSTTVIAAGQTTPEADTPNTVDTFDRIATVASSVVTGTSVTPTTGNNTAQFTDWPHAISTQATAVEDLVYLMKYQIDYKLNGMHSRRITDPTGYSSSLENARENLEVNRKFLIEETVAYMNSEYPTLRYGQTKLRRDAGYVLDALRYDLTYGGNALSVQAGLAYYDGDDDTQPVLAASIKDEYIDALTYLKTTAQSVAGDTQITTPKQTVVTQTLTGNAGNITEIANKVEDIVDIITNGPDAVGDTTTLVDPTPADGVNTTTALIAAYNDLDTNASTISTATNAWIASNYPDLTYNATKCARDVEIILKAVGFDFMFDSNYQTLKAAHAYLRETASEVYTLNQKTVTRAAIDYALKTLAIANVNSDATAIARVEASADLIDYIIYGASNEGSVCQTQDQNVYYALLQLERNREFIKAEVSAWIDDQIANASSGSIWENYTYNETLCLRDVDLYIDAIKYDLQYPGNYSSRYVSRFYANSVTGSQEEDMFYLRDATGVRLMTVNGLSGDLLPANEFGTSRPSAGAYASLDPGFGPEDFRTWIITRSPYVQNVTTLGTAAVGQKIDGALHNGGNDSIVSNDFTQVISDGIGAWLCNNGRAEMVSVFTYYSHIGYLAESGGRARATNGNNSYGDFGSVAEGVDPDEIPVTAIVDNKTQYNATISNVVTDSSQLLSIEYTHAGNDYTEATYNIFGPGSNEVLIADEFRSKGVNYVLVDQDADPDVPLGGSGYLITSNVAQSGSLTGIFLSATDGALSTAYPGMKIYIIGGAGVGQYAIIDTYNAGSKEVTVLRESDGTAGWDHVVPGTPIVAPNSSSTYQIEPRVQFSAPVREAYGSSILGSIPDIQTRDLKFVLTSGEYTDTATIGGSGSGATFDVVRNAEKYYLTLNNGGTEYTRLDTIYIAGNSVGGSGTGTGNNNDIEITITSVNSVTGAIVDFDFTGIGRRGRFLGVGDNNAGFGTGGLAIASENGALWSSETLPTLSSGFWNALDFGFIDDGSSTYKPSAIVVVGALNNEVAYSSDSDNWSNTTLPAGLGTGGYKTIAFGEVLSSGAQRFVVVSASTANIAYSDNGGATWTEESAALPGTGLENITYGGGKWVVVGPNTTNAAYSENGVTWTSVTAPGTFLDADDDLGTGITYGNGKFVALGGTNGVMYSLDGITWYENDKTLPVTASFYRNVEYGEGIYVITTDDPTDNMFSEDGLNWETYTSGSTPGGFAAAAVGGNQLDGTRYWVTCQFRNTGVTVSGIRVRTIGATAKARASVSNEQVFAIRITEPGSQYDSAPTITITDPNNIEDVVLVPQTGNGVLAQPTFVNRGTGFITASAEIDSQNSNGNADFPQSGTFIAVRRLTERPVNGSNVEFASLPGEFYKLVNVVSFLGTNDGSYQGFLQLSPGVTIPDRLPDLDEVEMRIRFSQVRLTGHDFLDIGTGNFTSTNYPGTPLKQPDQDKETTDSDGGRVFYTATDQDGNFRVGDLFTIEQSTGVATLNADAFNIAGLQELSLGEVTLGGNSATINEFSTDPFFTANSDNVVPTQRAVKAYIESQIGGGGASLNVNSVTAGDIFIGSDTITTLSGSTLNIRANVVFSGTILGQPLAFNYFLR